jgi:hypothetical protein
MTLAPNFATVITGVAVTGGNVNDTGGKFAAGVNDTGRKVHRDQQHQQKICHRCQQHRWQIIRTILDCLHLKVNLKEKKFIYMLTLLPKVVQTK